MYEMCGWAVQHNEVALIRIGRVTAKAHLRCVLVTQDAKFTLQASDSDFFSHVAYVAEMLGR